MVTSPRGQLRAEDGHTKGQGQNYCFWNRLHLTISVWPSWNKLLFYTINGS